MAKFNTSGRDMIVSGKVFHADAAGEVEVPDQIAIAEGLIEKNPDTSALIEEALHLGVLGPNGKPASRSVLERWKYERLVEAIADLKAAAEDDDAGDDTGAGEGATNDADAKSDAAGNNAAEADAAGDKA